MKKVILLGSSRSDGNTAYLVNNLADKLSCDIIDLSRYTISSYDYLNKNSGDDFLTIAKNIVDNYETIIFATPVYWYSMSSQMKVFVDRLTDLITVKKRNRQSVKRKKSSCDYLIRRR